MQERILFIYAELLAVVLILPLYRNIQINKNMENNKNHHNQKQLWYIVTRQAHMKNNENIEQRNKHIEHIILVSWW